MGTLIHYTGKISIQQIIILVYKTVNFVSHLKHVQYQQLCHQWVNTEQVRQRQHETYLISDTQWKLVALFY